MPRNSAQEVLMERDGLTMAEADQAVSETMDLILQSDPFDAADIMLEELGLEPDYLESMLCW